MNGFNSEMDKIAVIGLGYVGLPLSLLFARNFNVIGFDTDIEKVSMLIKGENPISEPGVDELLQDVRIKSKLKFTKEIADLKEAKIKIITVGTPYDLTTDYIDYSQLNSAVDLLKGVIKDDDIIILKSTVPPGTTNGIVRKKIESFGFKIPEQVGLAFSPERMVEGQAIKDFTSLPKIIGASDPKTKEIVSHIIGSLGGHLVPVSSPETAEMVKMVDNYSRYVFIGLTNEIALISEKVGVDVLELISASKQHYPRNSGLMIPGPGVGGSCLNKDPFILKAHLKRFDLKLNMVNAAATVNRLIPSHIANLVFRYANGRKSVLIAGVAFKGDTDDTRFTSTFEIMSELEKKGFITTLCDPYVKAGPIKISKDIYEASVGNEILLILTDHNEYKYIDLQRLKAKMIPNPMIIDTRGLISRENALNLGFEFHGFGRL